MAEVKRSRTIAVAAYLVIGAGLYLTTLLLAGGLGIGLPMVVEALITVLLWPIVLILSLLIVSGGR